MDSPDPSRAFIIKVIILILFIGALLIRMIIQAPPVPVETQQTTQEIKYPKIEKLKRERLQLQLQIERLQLQLQRERLKLEKLQLKSDRES